jgi:hypothetical protein
MPNAYKTYKPLKTFFLFGGEPAMIDSKSATPPVQIQGGRVTGKYEDGG